MTRLLATCMLAGALAACGSQSDQASNPDTSPVAPAPAATPVAAVAPSTGGTPNAALATFAKGELVEATKATQCRETGANAGEPPWDVAAGSFARVVAVEGDQVRVELAGSECLIPAAAVKPSAG